MGLLEGAVVVVVGAGGGLGRPLCSALSARGAIVVPAGPHPERLEGLAPGDGLAVRLDVRDPAAGDRLRDTVLARYGRIDGLVNAAGVVAFGDLADTDDEVIEELFLTNVIGPLWLLRRLVPVLAEHRGFVLQVSAVVAEQPLPGMAAYAASKAALTAADAALARELRRSGIHVCDARPPHTETGLAGRALAGRAPSLPTGLEPSAVAERLVVAIEAKERELPSEAFGAA
jgi:NAD(P)-dependent dehydrogenase (short-subunit alcohol dehydrogenase family)